MNLIQDKLLTTKSLGVFFSTNVRRDKQQELRSILGVYHDLSESKYSGLPSLVGRSKKGVFKFVKDRVHKKNSRMKQ